jgi:hypothetical protein
MLGFAIEQLLSGIEDAFGQCGIRLGQITNDSLAVLGALRRKSRSEQPAPSLVIVVAGSEGYSLQLLHEGNPWIYRYKGLAELPPEEQGGLLVRELLLTRNFLHSKLPDAALGRALLLVPEENVAAWKAWIERGLGLEAEVLGWSHLPARHGELPASWIELAPLLGAACREVA